MSYSVRSPLVYIKVWDWGPSRCLVDLETLKLPVRIREGCRVACNKLGAATGTLELFGVELRLAGELTAQIDIGNDALVAEMRLDIAIGAWEVGQGGYPGRWIRAGIRVGDIAWDGRAWEEPDTDSFLSQLRRIYLQ